MDLELNYEISRVANFILSNNFIRVALQFPDELLKDSTMAVKALRQELDASVKLYVMADTTYGSCCVDEVGAAHVNAECVIHFGHTCLSPTSTLPALVIFGKSSINASNCVENLLDCGLKSGKPVLNQSHTRYKYSRGLRLWVNCLSVICCKKDGLIVLYVRIGVCSVRKRRRLKITYLYIFICVWHLVQNSTEVGFVVGGSMYCV